MKLKKCPFCGGTPIFQHAKLTHCSLHGDPAQEIIIRCNNNDCVAKPSVRAGDIYNGGEQKARNEAVEKWNVRKDITNISEGDK